MKRLLILLTLVMFNFLNCTNTQQEYENIFNNNENNTTQDKTEEEEEIQKEITLTSSKLTNVTIKTPPAKTEYTVGETFTSAGLALTANYTDTYSDQSTKPSAKDLAYADIQNDLTFAGTDFAAAGTKTVTVTYKGKNATFDVTIKELPAPLTSVTITDIDSYKIPDNFADNGNIHLDLTGEISLLKISDIAKAFPNATITANDKISYTINGGTKRGDIPADIFTYNTLVDNEFKDLTTFAIEGKILIDETTDVNLSDDIEITTYDNSENSSPTHANITSDIAKTQFDALGLTTPNFDLVISDKNLYNFAHDILDNYDSFDDEKHKVKVRNVSFIDGSILGKSLYEGNELQSDVPSIKFSSIEYVTTDVSNTKITGDVTSDTTTDINFTNVVFEGDVSGIKNDGIYEGVIHFKDEPMKALYSSNTLIKIDKIPTGDKAFIAGDIMDFRTMSDDLTSDSNYNIDNLQIGAYHHVKGYFNSEDQKDTIVSKIQSEVATFKYGTYVTAIPEQEKYMKTLSEIEDAANGKGEYTLTELLRDKHNTVTRTE